MNYRCWREDGLRVVLTVLVLLICVVLGASAAPM